MSKIFVQMASYCDPELGPTLQDCLAKAEFPERLVFGICWQHAGQSRPTLMRGNQFRVLEIPSESSRGVCWARNLIQHRLYDGEPFTLHLDSHHRFVEHWDSKLLKIYHDLQTSGSSKPLLTSYAPHYDPHNKMEWKHEPLQLNFDSFDDHGLSKFRPGFIENVEKINSPIPGRFFSGHFAFTSGEFCEVVPHDPVIYFYGEELNMAIRAYTHGYDLFSPHRTILHHQYTRAQARKHWDDAQVEKGASENWWDMERPGLLRMRGLLEMSQDKVPKLYGLGSERSLEDYQTYAGIHFKAQTVTPQTLQGKPPY